MVAVASRGTLHYLVATEFQGDISELINMCNCDKHFLRLLGPNLPMIHATSSCAFGSMQSIRGSKPCIERRYLTLHL